jgi:hypothetical protein
MTRFFIAGVAALFLATGAAHANDQLPEHLLGQWCSTPFASTESQVVYFRPDLKDPGRKTCSCAHFRLIQMPCCGQLLCWVNPRLPNYLDRGYRAR